jgi:hypothetical protein
LAVEVSIRVLIDIFTGVVEGLRCLTHGSCVIVLLLLIQGWAYTTSVQELVTRLILLIYTVKHFV